MSPKVSQAYKEERKAIILEGALHCFTEKGFQATTIDDIVRHLGISKGAIYSYFASKEEMYIQMADDKMNAMLENSTELFKSMPSAADQIRYMYGRFRSQSLNELRKWMAFHLEFMLYAARQPQLTERWNEYAHKALVFIQDIMDGGKQTGEFRSDLDSAAASRMFWSIRDGLALQYMLSGEETDYKRMIDEMESMVFRYILV
ncbi:TetR/AcrR family transcriptional regulator [Paenibacillus aceris]|uniref:AcrR family transcriptional regulator n=1 Tax=Paenibacillus aceris TaxID=869555 RepID=A0ABS4I0J6_9BACL|nr:TetR/AcrR family transcriptional regulator [Paenibacillus aceris]MBP1964437.1 AcrR family transcriptional regulator [Paenibacillus aceris]NHW35849.1 TetR/AcrR family transcriptional regulator [Paenibacillus aceris]